MSEEESREQLVAKLDALMKRIEKSEDLKLIEASTAFTKSFHAYIREVLKPLEEAGMLVNKLTLSRNGDWDVTWRNE